jgi:ATP-dependent Clp protease adaptor protein ClpS
MSDPLVPDSPDTGVVEKTEEKLAPPPMYRAILVNDDFTPREFVVYVLASIFRKSQEQARSIMLTAHQGGRSVIGVYTHDVAASRAEQARQRAHEAGYPLQIYVEEV